MRNTTTSENNPPTDTPKTVELTEDGYKVEEQQHHHTNHGQLVVLELPPHQLPLRGEIVALVYGSDVCAGLLGPLSAQMGGSF